MEGRHWIFNSLVRTVGVLNMADYFEVTRKNIAGASFSMDNVVLLSVAMTVWLGIHEWRSVVLSNV